MFLGFFLIGLEAKLVHFMDYQLFHFIPFQFFFVFLHRSYYFCNMQQDYDSSASGYIKDSFEGISREFTDVEILTTSDTNIVAKAKRYGRWWLLKGLNKDVAGETGYQQRLRKELEIVMPLQHPNIVTAVGLEEVEGLGLCIVMEYVDGMTLKEWLQGKTTRQAQRRVLRELLEAIDYIHKKGIVHRDLKPENIIITRNGENVKLIDFGLADTDSHAVLKQPAGTTGYMSPEQKEIPVADVRNDIYSLGVIMQQMNLGRGYLYIINRCVAPIDKRWGSISEMLQGIKRLRSLQKTAWVIAGLVALAMLVILVVWMMNTARTTEVTNTNTEIRQDRQQAVSEAIQKGEDRLMKEMDVKNISHQMDTVSSIIYLKNDWYMKLSTGMTLIDKYIEEIERDFSESEIEKIKNTLTSFLEKIEKQWINKYNQMKEEYDRSFEE